MTVIREDRVVTIAAERGLRGPAGQRTRLVSGTVESTGTFWTLTPDEAVVGIGEDQIFFGRAPAAHSGTVLYIKVLGINDAEERPVVLADDITTVAVADVPEGSSVAVCYSPTGKFQLIWPAMSAAAASSIVMMDQTARVGNILTFEPKSGFALPNNTGIGVLMGGKFVGAPAASVVALAIEGITLDPLELKYLDGTSVEPSRIADGAYAIWTRNAVTGFYDLLAVWDTDHAQGGGSGSSLSEYQTIEARRAADSAAAARAIARDALILS